MTRHVRLSLGLVCVLGIASGGCGPTAVPPPSAKPVDVVTPAPKVESTPSAIAKAPEPEPKPKPPVVSIRPAKATLLAGDPGLQMVADPFPLSDGYKDCSAATTWSAEPAGVVNVEASGYVRAVKPGKAKIRASFVTLGQDKPVVAEAEVTVGDAPRSWDFGQDIAPILTRAGATRAAATAGGMVRTAFICRCSATIPKEITRR